MTVETKICPFCGGEILATAKKCKHCKQFLDNSSSNTAERAANSGLTFNNEQIAKIIENKKIMIPVVIAVVIIAAFINNSAGVVLSGCNYEKSSGIAFAGRGRADWYICKNRPYTSVQINHYDNSPYISHHVYKKYLHGEYYDDILIAQRYRYDGEYECDSYAIDEKIRPCSMAQFKRLAKKGGENLESHMAMSKAKGKISNTLENIRKIRGEYQVDKKYEIYRQNRQNGYSGYYKDIPNPPLPSTLGELMKSFNYYLKVNYEDIAEANKPKYIFSGHEAKAPNGNIIAFSDDLQYLTVYDSETPKYYVTVKMNFENTEYEYVDKIIPADKYIKSTSNLRQLTEEEMK